MQIDMADHNFVPYRRGFESNRHRACLIATQISCPDLGRLTGGMSIRLRPLKQRLFCRPARAYALGALLSCAASGQAFADWQIYVDSGLLHDSNLSRASRAEDVRADSAFAVTASAGQFIAPTGADGFTVSADASAEAYDRYDGLNHVAAGGTASWRHKFGLGYLAPWTALSASALHDDYRSDIRDSTYVHLLAEAGRRFSETFDASMGMILERRYAANDDPVVPGISGRVFDLAGRGVFVRAGYAATDHLLVGMRADVRRGDVVSTSKRNREIFLASSAIAEDPTFGDELYDYRLRGTTWTASAFASWALTDTMSLNLSYADQRTQAASGLDYRSRTGHLSFSYGY
ncbi:MAG TPA: hypothetical protein VLM36_06040 [Sphingomicrobium sp.]|nr:hypothetical protein [Sphingomicrobium sp.]